MAKRKGQKNGIAKWLRSPDGPKAKVIPDKRKRPVCEWCGGDHPSKKHKQEDWT